MSKKYPVFLLKSHMGRKPGDTILVHKRARTALITSKRACDPKDAARHRARLGIDDEAPISFTLAEGTPSRRNPRKRETIDQKPAETKPTGPATSSSATGVDLAREALAATARGYLVRKSACAALGLDTSGTDELLADRLKTYIAERG